MAGPMGVLFLVPSALLTAELGAAFPAEGGHYVWTRARVRTRRRRRLGAALLDRDADLDRRLAGYHGDRRDRGVRGAARPRRAAGVRARDSSGLAVAATVAPIRLGRLVPASGAIARVVLIALLSATVSIYAVVHGVHGYAVGHLEPSGAGFAALVPVLFYNYLGFDVPAAAAGEMRDPSATSRPASCAPARGPSCSTPRPCSPPARAAARPHHRPDRIRLRNPRGVHGLRARRRRARYAGAAAAVRLGAVTSGATWLMASARSQAIACLDGAGPRRLGAFSAQGTPARLAVVSGIVASVVSLATFSIAGSSAERYFAVALSLSIAVIALSYVAIFAAPVRLRGTRSPTSSARSVCPAARVGLSDLQRALAGLDGRRAGAAAVAAAPAEASPRRPRNVPADAGRAARAAGRVRARIRVDRPTLGTSSRLTRE